MAMPVHREGEMGSGHGCGWYPRANNGGSSNVIAGGIGVHREGDSWTSHYDLCQNPPGDHEKEELDTLAQGSKTVKVNGKGCARIGDPVACGSVAVQGISTVLAGG